MLVLNNQAQQLAECNENYKVAGNTLPCKPNQLSLGDSTVEIRVYTKKLPNQTFNKTFAVVHNDEQTGLNAVKEVISQKGGRLVEVVSKNKSRYLSLKLAGKTICIDPNRIYTDEGIKADLQDKMRGCKYLTEEEAKKETNIAPVRTFAQNLQNIIQDKGNSNYKFIVAVHNNDPGGCLTFEVFSKSFLCDKKSVKQTEKVLESTPKDNIDNFIIVTTPTLFDALKNKGFHLVLQVGKEKLTGDANDGSMSVYASLNDLRYIVLETQCKSNGAECKKFKDRQKEMIGAVLPMQ
ncbi:MAG: hypothetical protein LUM44_19715 [Pyrinomonadaceae bacterium]|nr:hypothetical protein [Pyrinomonadaceae bacterium]